MERTTGLEKLSIVFDKLLGLPWSHTRLLMAGWGL